MDPMTSTSLPPLINNIQQLTFGWTDYTLFVSLLGLSLLIGFYFGFFSKQNSASEYLFGGKHMAYIPIASSILASLLSGITFLGIPTEVYFHGGKFIYTLIPNIASCLLAAHVILPIFYDLRLSSSYEYLELRFSKSIRTLASFSYIISMLLYIPVVIYVPALAFAQVTGYSIHMITPVFSLVCITYTTMGGVKAVVWTDTIQLLFTVGGLFTVLVIGIVTVGGFTELWRIVGEGGRLNFTDTTVSPFERNTILALVFGSLFNNLSRFAIGQKFVQRFLAIDRKVDIKKSVYLMGLGWIILQVGVILTGLAAYARYHDCDPLKAKLVQRNDQTIPYYVMDVAQRLHGLPGIFLAGLVSSALSTMSASLNSLSGLIYEDFIAHWLTESQEKDARSATIMKVISAVIGIIAIGMVFVIERLGTIFEMANSLCTLVDGPLLGLFLSGMFLPWIGRRGAVLGAGFGLGFMSWLVVGTQWHVMNGRIRHTSLPTSLEGCPYPLNETTTASTPPILSPEDEPFILFKLSFMYVVFAGTAITVIVAFLASWTLGETDLKNVNPKHVAPVVRRFLPKDKYVEVPMKDIAQGKIKIVECKK